jgi:hypothetical protein
MEANMSLYLDILNYLMIVLAFGLLGQVIGECIKHRSWFEAILYTAFAIFLLVLVQHTLRETLLHAAANLTSPSRGSFLS